MASNSRYAVAIHILAYLGCRKTDDSIWCSSREIASSVKTNSVVIRRLLADLTRAGLVESQAGKNGGSRLAKSPLRISLLDIFQAVADRGLFRLPKKSANRRCAVSCRMEQALVPIFATADKAAEKSLKKVTLASLIRPLVG